MCNNLNINEVIQIILNSNQKLTSYPTTFMFTQKANSKQNRVKKHKNHKNRSPDSTHGRAVHTHGRAKKDRSSRTAVLV